MRHRLAAMSFCLHHQRPDINVGFFPFARLFQEQLLSIYSILFYRSANVDRPRPLFPGFYIILPINVEALIDAFAESRILDRKADLYAPEEISCRPVRAGEIDFRVTCIFKTVDPTMFQKSADNAAYDYIFTHSRHPWTQAADTSDQKIYLYAGLGSRTQSFDDFFIDERVDFAENGSWFPTFRVVHFALDHFNDKLVKRLRRCLHFFQCGKYRDAGQPV